MRLFLIIKWPLSRLSPLFRQSHYLPKLLECGPLDIWSGHISSQFSVHDLACYRDDLCLFEHLSFALNPGECLLIEGKNGCGKTTLLRCLSSLRMADEGEIRWQGESIGDLGPNYMANLSYIGHADGLKLDLTPRENLTSAQSLGPKKAGQDIEKILERVRLYGLEDVPTRVLSAGQKRRLALARLLLSGAPLWILDEPLSSLDRAGIELFIELLQQHLDQQGLAVLTTHHRIVLQRGGVKQLNMSQP